MMFASPFFESLLSHSWSETVDVSESNDSGDMEHCTSGLDDQAVSTWAKAKPIIARLTLTEEKASAFQDLLFFVYPHLALTVTWANVEDLVNMARKFDMPLLKRECVRFLSASSAADARRDASLQVKIAEDHELADVYKEASRFVLDNFNNWEPHELAELSESTLLKLERKRSWFLERLLKLGFFQLSRDYICCPSCQHPLACANLVDEKIRSAYSSCVRYRSPQPSLIYRSVRQLEASVSSPALHLPMTACQSHAKAYVADLFDRMFSIGPEATPIASSLSTTRDIGSIRQGAKYFLFINLVEPSPPLRKTPASRD